MKRYCSALAILGVTLGSPGCLIKETTHRVYLSPTGAVAWAVLDERVRSDHNDVLRRSNEELEWLRGIAAEMHPVAEGLQRLGADEVSTRLLRLSRPYVALTDARFARADQLIGRLLAELGMRGEARFETTARNSTLSVALDLSSLDDARPDIESPVTALLEDLDRYRFILTDGRFDAATGFDILDDGTTAALQEIPEASFKAGAVLTLRLSWRVGGQ